MNADHIRQSMARVQQHLAEHPERSVSQDLPAVASVEEGLRCRATGPHGWTLASDMPAALGGGASAPTAGWLLRAALANCDATIIAMRAAQLGIRLTRLEVTVGSESDTRGIVGAPDPVPAGPLRMQVRIRLAAEGAEAGTLHELVRWAEEHSPVGDAVRRAVEVSTEVVVETDPAGSPIAGKD